MRSHQDRVLLLSLLLLRDSRAQMSQVHNLKLLSARQSVQSWDHLQLMGVNTQFELTQRVVGKNRGKAGWSDP